MTLNDLLKDIPLDRPNYMIPTIKPTVMNTNATMGMTLTLALILSMPMQLNPVKSWY